MKVADLATWMHATVPGGLGFDSTVPVVSIAQVDNASELGKAVFVAPTGGPGLALEGATDNVTHQFRVQGDQGNADEAYTSGEDLALTLDQLMITARFPTTIGGRPVLRVTRLGGPPAYLLSRNRRAHFTASYLFELAAT